jgi:flavin-dependent dehydrogenase
MPSADRARQVPVVIVGAGPAGLVAAATLARNGIASLLVERTRACRRCRGPRR